jgi:hypothetical protein
MYILPEIEVFSDAGFEGNSWRFNWPPDWGWTYVGDDWNDTISSVIILSGQWQFFENATNFNDGQGGASVTLGPGYYSYVEDSAFNMANDSISAILCVSDQPEGDNPVEDMSAV